jgi:hypothetical protein
MTELKAVPASYWRAETELEIVRKRLLALKAQEEALRFTNLEQGEMKCPQCGASNLHHEDVRVYSRGEDAPTRLTVVRGAGGLVTQEESNYNPSSRRHAVSISFWCENCPGSNLRLDVIQHKGTTYTEWKVASDRDY